MTATDRGFMMASMALDVEDGSTWPVLIALTDTAG
jgi:hypothetical protein